jgi:tetratricopeptide (TPR) repeat protein
MRYFEKPNYYPTQINFFQTLKQKTISLKKFQITNLGFIQPTIEVLLTPSSNSLIVLNKGMGFSDLPRPFDYFWNGGLSFLNKGLLDRDDRTIKLGLSHRYTTTLVSSKTGQEMIVFMQNGPEKSTVKIQLGYTSRIRSLKPGEFHVLKFKPKWFFPKKPALYHFEAGLPEGKNILIQLRCGNREIGEAYTKWGKWEKSLPYLKQALADNANDPEVGLLLAENYEKLNRIADAREVIKEVLTRNPLYSPMLFSLGKANVSITQWENQFQEYTGLNPSLLRYALSQEYTMDKAFPSPSGAGEMKDNCQASGGKVIIYDRAIHKPAEVMHGPYLHLDQGAYLAGFFLRTWEVQGVGPFAEIRVLADDKVISKQSVSVKDLKEDNKQFKEVRIPFINGGPRPEIKFQVFATGKASFAVEKIRLEPDLRKTFQKKWAMLKAVGGENLVGEGRNRGLN